MEEVATKARYQQERKRKGKMPAKQVQKKARKANPTLTIPEPIQVPFSQKSSEEERTSEEEGTRNGELYSMSIEVKNTADTVSLIDETKVIQMITYERMFMDLDEGLLDEMGRFEDPKLQKMFNKKVSGDRCEVRKGDQFTISTLNGG